MTVNFNENGYEMLRGRTPVIEWYAELQKADGSAAEVTPMTFSLPVTGADVTLPCQIERVHLFEGASGGDSLAAESVEPLLLVLAADAGAVVLTITLPAVV